MPATARGAVYVRVSVIDLPYIVRTVSVMARELTTRTRGLLACLDKGQTVILPASAARIAASITDETERALWIRHYHAAGDYEAAQDGALHHAYGADADRRYRLVVREYDAASAALITYRRNRAAGTGI